MRMWITATTTTPAAHLFRWHHPRGWSPSASFWATCSWCSKAFWWVSTMPRCGRRLLCSCWASRRRDRSLSGSWKSRKKLFRWISNYLLQDSTTLLIAGSYSLQAYITLKSFVLHHFIRFLVKYFRCMSSVARAFNYFDKDHKKKKFAKQTLES